MGGSSDGGGESIIRHRPNIEAAHDLLVVQSQAFGNLLHNDSPYTGFIEKDYTDSLYGAGYTMASFPSLYDMYGKFVAGLDIESLFEQILNSTQNSTTVLASSTAHNSLLTDDIEQTVLPRYQLGMRNMNAVMSSTFIIGQSIIEQGRIKKVAEFDADLKYKLIPVAAEVFAQHLKWNQGVISTYLEVMKLATVIEFDTDAHNYEHLVKHYMWPFTIMAQERAIIGALAGGGSAATAAQEASTTQKVVGGMASGAAMGAQVGGGYGAAIGAVVGGIAGYFS